MFLTDFQEKATLFNNIFASQCTFFWAIIESISDNVLFSDDGIITHIRGLNHNKAHGCDGITIHTIQICDNTLLTPLSIIYTNCIKKGVFPKLWKMANVVPVYKKDSKHLMKNYRPISLLPVFDKIFEKILFNNLYPYPTSNNLISDKQSGFKQK